MIIAITKPDFFDSEAKQIISLLNSGKVDLVHIRKPQQQEQDVERLLNQLPQDLCSRLVIHDHFGLARRFALRGVHLNSRNPAPPEHWNGAVSISCHSISELAICRQKDFAYMSLSPIFNSISKPGYNAAFTAEELEQARQQGIIDHRVFALGGVTFSNISNVLKMGFGGAMLLGDVWK